MSAASGEITISGAAFDEALDPLTSNIASEVGLPEPTSKRCGAGWRVTYSGLTIEQMREIADYLSGFAEDALAFSDSDRAPAYAMRKAAARIRKQIQEMTA